MLCPGQVIAMEKVRGAKWYKHSDHPFSKCKRSKCEECQAAVCFRMAVMDERRVLPKAVEDLKKAGKTYISKWFKERAIQQEGPETSKYDGVKR
jgi:hypothetical protein